MLSVFKRGYTVEEFESVLSNGGHGAVVLEWCSGFIDNRHWQFVEGCSP